MRRIPLKIALAVSCFSPTAASVLAADIADAAAKSSEIKTFSFALKESGMEKRLKEKGPYTVFAPANLVFQNLSSETTTSLFKDKKKLEHFVAKHIVQGSILARDMKPGTLTTLAGTEIRVGSDNGKITVNDVNVRPGDIQVDNGVIHIVDSVLDISK
jgi:uncharacterized surface protein with fasciclin (FAS1) repeats